MGLFDRLYYGKAGKRDYSEMDMPKNRISLFFMVLKDHVFDLIKVNLMQLIFWIPFLLWTYINLAAVQSIDTETMIRRLPYPATLETSDPEQYEMLLKELGGPDHGGTRLWWDTGCTF